MNTQLVFKLQNQPDGYGYKFSKNCKIEIKKTSGNLYLDYNRRYIMGHYENLRTDGENVLADVTLFENNKVIEHRLEYAIEGQVLNTVDGEVSHFSIAGVGALMPNKS